MLGLGASLRLLDAAIKGDAAAHAGYESAGAMAAACAALATSKRTAGKGLAEVVCCLARDGVPAAVLVDFVGDSLELARLVQRKEGYYSSWPRGTDASWNGATVAHALCAGRDRLLADHSTTVNALQLPPGASVCLAQFGHSHTQFEAAFTKAMRRAATTSEAGAFAAFRILRALADTTSSYTGASAARLVDVVGDVLVQALSVTFPLRQITVPAYYRNDAARAATYVTEETEKARKEAKDAAAVTLTAALSALAVPGATTARCLAAAAPIVGANAARFDGIVAVPAAVMAPLYRRNVLEPAAVSALEAIAAAAATAPAPSQKLSVEQCESLLITLAATGGAGRRAALFDEQDAWTVVRAAASILSGGLSNAVYDRRGQYSRKTLAKVVYDDLSLPRILLAAMARVPTVTAERWSRSPVLETPRNALAAAVYALCAGESRGATGQLDALAALVARTPAFDPLRAVAPAIEMLADVTSRRPRLQAEGLASPALLALCSLALAPLRSATVAPPPLKDWKLTVDLGLGDAWKVKSIEEFFADPVADKRTHAIRDDDDERVARKIEELQSPDAFTTTRTESRYGPRLEIAKVPAGQAPKEDIRARIASEELRAKDLATLRTLEGLLPQPSGPPTAGDSSGEDWDSSDGEPEKKKQRA